jgi:hypothetical protein
MMLGSHARNIPEWRNLRQLTACDRNGVGVDFAEHKIRIGGIKLEGALRALRGELIDAARGEQRVVRCRPSPCARA